MLEAPTGLLVTVDNKERRVRGLVSLLLGAKIYYDDDTVDFEFFEEVEKMFSSHVVEWLDKHHPKMLTVETAVRWGLADSDGNCLRHTEDNSVPYQVTCCVLASGRLNGWNNGSYYVCDRRYAEPEQFWEAPFFTITSYQSFSSNDDVCRYRIQTHDDDTITVETTWQSRAAYLESVDDWCMQHPDKVYDLSASGARNPSGRSRESGLLTVTPVYCKTSSDCVVASIVNMICTVEGPTVARALFDIPPTCSIRKLGSLNTWLEKSLSKLRKQLGLKQTYSMCVPNVDEPPWMFDLTYFVTSAKSGKYIVRLSGFDYNMDEVDHTVFVDGDRQLVFDCMETHAMRLSYEAFECCIGDGIFIGAKDVRVVKMTKLNSGNRKPRRKKRRVV